MGILDKLAPQPRRQGGRASSFSAAEPGRLTASLANETEFINVVLRQQLRALRARSRQAMQNNPFGKRFAQLAVDNIAGPEPFRLQAKTKYKNGKFDRTANMLIEDTHRAWSRKGNCEVTRRWHWNTVQRLMAQSLPTDGELLFRKLRGPKYGPHGFMLQMIDPDLLDDQLNKNLGGGNAISMGVEMDSRGRPVAYHLLKRKPQNWMYGYAPREHERVPAEEIEHVFVPMFVDQTRGIPWVHAALLNMVHLGAGEEAAVIAFRVGAAQMGFLQQREESSGVIAADGEDSKGNPQFDADPGAFPYLPAGYEVSGWNPRYPDAAVEPFVKTMLRGMASGLGVAYHNLANDPSDVNYSTAKVFGGEEHEMWKGVQRFFVDHVHEPLYRDWLRQQVVIGKLPFSFDRLDKYAEVSWNARRWASPDPLKDAKADIELINNRLKSRTRSVAERGDDIEDVFDEQANEMELADEKGIELPDGKGAPAAGTASDAGDEPDGEADDDASDDGQDEGDDDGQDTAQA